MSHRRSVLAVLGLVLAALVPLNASPASAAGTVTVMVTGQGTVTGTGINCTQAGGPDCSEFYADDEETFCDPDLKPPCQTVHFPPTASFTAGEDTNGYVYDGWTGCDSTSGRTCTIEVDSDATVTARFRDAQAPSVSVPSPSSGVQHGVITLSAAAIDNAGVQRVEFLVRGVVVGSDSFAPYSVLFDTSSIADGAATVQARAVDGAGQTASSSQGMLTIDNTAPALTVSGPDGALLGVGDPAQWTIDAQDATSGVATVVCSLVPEAEGDSFGACSGGMTGHEALDLADGSYRFAVRATDAAGLVVEVVRHFAVDTTPPRTMIKSGPAKTVKTRHRQVKARFKLAAHEPVTSFLCKLDGKKWKSCSATPTFKVRKGKHVLRVESVDLASNRDKTPAKWRWTVKRKR